MSRRDAVGRKKFGEEEMERKTKPVVQGVFINGDFMRTVMTNELVRFKNPILVVKRVNQIVPTDRCKGRLRRKSRRNAHEIKEKGVPLKPTLRSLGPLRNEASFVRLSFPSGRTIKFPTGEVLLRWGGPGGSSPPKLVRGPRNIEGFGEGAENREEKKMEEERNDERTTHP